MYRHESRRQTPAGNRQIAAQTASGMFANAIRHPQELRFHFIRDLWSTSKRFGARFLDNVEIREIPGIRDAVVEGFIDDRNRGVLAALCAALRCATFFEIGTNRGRTAWTVARNNSSMQVYTLDLPTAEAADSVELELLESDRSFFQEWDRGGAFKNTPEGDRIQQLFGDSATFDFTAYAGRMDMVFIDGSHSYAYVQNDTQAALRMLSPTGTIVWDDFPAFPGVYAYLSKLSSSLDQRLFHIRETRLVVYSRQSLLSRLEPAQYASSSVA